MKEEEKKKEEAQEHKVTYWSLTSKKIIDDDTIGIQGPINMDMLSPKELMEIASSMQSKAKKKIMRTQRREAKTIQTVVDIFFNLLLETDTNSLTTPIEKLDHLVTTVGEQMRNLGEATIHNLEKEYEKKIIEILIKETNKDIEGLTVNMDKIKEALNNGGKILSTIYNFSLFFDDLVKKRKEAQQELKRLSESFDPLNDSTIIFGRSLIVIQHKLNPYEAKRIKRTTSL